LLALAEGDTNPDGVTYELMVGCFEDVVVDVIDDDIER
jgi:hypothetical protein